MPNGDEISFKKGNSLKRIYDDRSVTLGDKRPSYANSNSNIRDDSLKMDYNRLIPYPRAYSHLTLGAIHDFRDW
jgi:hypothetical protein